MPKQTAPKVLVDSSFEDIPPLEMCEKLLNSHEFEVQSLARLAGKVDKKASLARRLSRQAILGGRVGLDRLALTLVKRKRTWGAFWILPSEAKPNVNGGIDRIFREWGMDGWWGPLVDSEDSSLWYVRTKEVYDYQARIRASGEEVVEPVRRFRWHVFAEVKDGTVTLYWDNFTRRDDDTRVNQKGVQFPYWKYISNFAHELFGIPSHSRMAQPDLFYPVLWDLWDDLKHNRLYAWSHKAVHAQSGGVDVNAHSLTKTQDPRGNGLPVLTEDLANQVCSVLGLSRESREKQKIKEALLTTLLREFGTVAYEVEIEGRRNREDEEFPVSSYDEKNKLTRIFHGRIFFESGSRGGQNCLTHFRCKKAGWGGARHGAKFLKIISERYEEI